MNIKQEQVLEYTSNKKINQLIYNIGENDNKINEEEILEGLSNEELIKAAELLSQFYQKNELFDLLKKKGIIESKIIEDKQTINLTQKIVESNKSVIYFREKLTNELKKPEKLSFNSKNRTDIPSIVNGKNQPYIQAEGLKITYPKNVKEAIKILYREYNNSFKNIIESSKETPKSYQYCFDKDGNPSIPFLQIDMPYLSQEFLNEIKELSPNDIANILSPFIFEYESSIARYPLLFGINNNNFKDGFTKNLDNIKNETGKKIILLSTTESKLKSIKEEEFGIKKGEPIRPNYIKENSGFDDLWGPKEFKKYYNHIEEGKESEYIFFTRASMSTEFLKTNNYTTSPILENDKMRIFIKENTITVNIDNPNDKNKIPVNDTKEYMEKLGLGYFFHEIKDILSKELLNFLETKKFKSIGFKGFNGEFYTERLKNFLISTGVNKNDLEKGKVEFRFKPVYESYGAYNQLSSDLSNAKGRKKLIKLLNGEKFVLQLERPTKKIINTNNSKEYLGINRLFPNSNCNGEISFNKSLINLMPNEKQETTISVHGGEKAEWGEIN